MRPHPSRFPIIAFAFAAAAGPVLGVIRFVQWADRAHADHLRQLRSQRDRVVHTLVKRQKSPRDDSGRFLPVKGLRAELERINRRLHAA